MIYGRKMQLLVVAILLIVVSGCMYPDQQAGPGSDASVREGVIIVQSAVADYQKNHQGMLPIKNSTIDTPYYEREVIDFSKLLGGRYISQAPRSAFENGGRHLYLIIDADTNPRVKLMDLVVMQTVNDVQRAVHLYRSKNYGQVPSDVRIAPNWYTIDFDKLGMKRIEVQSVYSHQILPLLVNQNGDVVVDYAIDIMTVINKQEDFVPDADQDLRELLVDNAYYAPVKSYPYYWQDGQPTIAQHR